ncbi:hypothetical protein [Streptomyces sp. NPDC058739]|uniref:hypothetical protein n=1 Tax=Streptomyces sp. NPDC058739 TaxID=3346618 RepID=UPI0036B260DA
MNTTLPALSPNYVTERSRVAKEHVEVYGKWPVQFQFRPAHGDHRHLLVVFSSVDSKYGFGAALDGVLCNVLRIRDHFDEGASYYVARNMDFSVSDSIQDLIQDYMQRLGLTRDEVTLLGTSKGGAAALYYGLKYDYKNIVSSTPQYFLGSYSKGHGQLGDAVLGEGQSDENVAVMDSVMKDLIEKEVDFNRNIYVISSPNDYQYEQEVKHYLPGLRAYENFNFLFLDSPTVQEHYQVTRQALPSVWSLVHALSEGLTPRFGEVRIGAGTEDPEKASAYLAELRQRDTVAAALAGAVRIDGKLHLKGHAFLPGVSPDGPTAETKRIILEEKGRSFDYPLDNRPGKKLYREYYDEYFCEYADGEFATDGGLDFTSLPRGTFDVSVSVASEAEGIERRTRLTSDKVIDRRLPFGDSEVIFRGGRAGLKVIKRNIVGADSPGARYSLVKAEADGHKLHAEGVFFLPGRNAERESHAAYYLVLQDRSSSYSFLLGAKKDPARVRPLVPEDDFGIYDAGYFTTGDEGLDVSEVPAGRYSLYVSMSTGGSLITKKAGKITLKKTR